MKLGGGKRHTLRVEFIGPNFLVCLDGKKVLTRKDAKFGDTGMVG